MTPNSINTHSIKADFLAARSKTTDVLMSATGWTKGVINPEKVGVDSIFFYVLDHQSKWLWSCSVAKPDFHEVIQRVFGTDHDHAVASCKHLIFCAATGAELDNQASSDLAIALTAYICKTKTFQLAQGGNGANHFSVIHYNASGSIRPFAMDGPARQLLDAGSVTSAMKKVVAMDAVNHPEWLVTQ